MHWEDMKQTALLAFLECGDRTLPYAYGTARIALKNFVWVHARGLNGDCKSLAARQYTLMDTADSMDVDDDGDDTLAWQLRAERTRYLVLRPVEWAVEGRQGPRPPEAADLFRHIVTLLVGVPRRSMVAVSAVGVNLSTSSRQVLDGPLEYRLFVDGFAEMVRRLEPQVVLSYGRLPTACHELVKVITYPTRWTNIWAARRRQIER